MAGPQAVGAPCTDNVDCVTLNCGQVFNPDGTFTTRCVSVDTGNITCSGAAANAAPH
jgi:hypothetical protein